MATATPPSSSKVSYPAEAVGRLFAPPESEVPADKLRRLLHEARAKKSFLHTAGAYDAFTSAIMTTLGFKTLYGSGWQLAATKSLYPDIGIYQSHQMVELVLEMRKGIEGARNTRWYDTEGKDLLDAPPAFVDMEAGFGGPTQTFTLATELIRVGAGGVHLENQDPSNRTCGHIVNVGKQKRNKVLVTRQQWLAKLKAIKAAAEATGVNIVIIARTDSIDGALPDQEPGGVKMAIEDAWETGRDRRARLRAPARGIRPRLPAGTPPRLAAAAHDVARGCSSQPAPAPVPARPRARADRARGYARADHGVRPPLPPAPHTPPNRV